MKVAHLVAVGMLVISCAVMTSGSSRLAIPLVPVAVYYSVANHWKYLAAAGLAGAALLKLKGAATVGTYLYLRDKGIVDVDFDHNNAGWDSNMAGGYSQNNHGRYKREAAAAAAATTYPYEENSISGVTFNPSLDEVLANDQLGCGLKLVCELSSIPRDLLQDDERIILTLFGGQDSLPSPYQSSRGKLSYAYAALLGNSAKDTNICARAYRRCPHEGTQIMQALRSVNV